MSPRLVWSRPILLVGTSLLLFTVSLLASLLLGEQTFSLWHLDEIWRTPSSPEYLILTHLRIPRLLTAIAIGGGLSLCGAILQGLFRNPIVEPYTLGISGGASLGVTLAIVMGVTASHFLVLPLFGFVGALATMFLVYVNSYRREGLQIERMLLVGVMISFMASSGVMFLMALATTDSLSSIIFWTMGSLQQSNLTIVVGLLIFSLSALVVSYFFAQALNALRLGETKAQQLGIHTRRVTLSLFFLCSLLTSACVAVGGVIGFVGLIVPQATRLLWGQDYRMLLLGSFLHGALFLLLCDLIARTIISPIELPIGVITGLIGGLAFLYLMRRNRRSAAH